jgi:hypothetical protein
VSAVVVHHEMEIEVFGDGDLNALQKTQELLMPLSAMQ